MLSAPHLGPPASPFAVHRAARDVAVPTTLIPEVAAGLPSIGINPPLNLDVASQPAVLHPDPNTITVIMTPTATPTPSPTAAAIAMGSPHDAAKEGDCELLGSFAIFVQLALGALALLALVYKRWRERPQRPVKIWFFDVSKQVFGSVLVHMANVFMSMLTSGRFSIKAVPPTTTVVSATLRMMLRARNHSGDDTYVPNPCSFYLLNLAIDTTLGIPVLILIVRITTKLVAYTPFGRPAESIQSGHYGSPPNAWWWLKQSFIYFCGLMGMKFCVLVLFWLAPWLSHVGDWALGWTEGNEKLQIVFVMMLFPLIMNMMQYYIIDSYIKKQESVDDVDDVDDGATAETIVYDEPSDSETDESGGEESTRKQLRGGHLRLARRDTNTPPPPGKDGEYDPDVDGDSQTIIGSSNSRLSPPRGLPKELIPAE